MNKIQNQQRRLHHNKSVWESGKNKGYKENYLESIQSKNQDILLN